MLCVIHGQNNVGLDERRDGLEANCTGEVEILRLDDSGRARCVEVRLMAVEPHLGILTLNGNVLAAAVRAVDAVDQRPVIGTVGIRFSLLARHLSVAHKVSGSTIDPTSAIQGC